MNEFQVSSQLISNYSTSTMLGVFLALILEALTVSLEYLQIFNKVPSSVPEDSSFDALLKFQDVFFLVASCFSSKI